MSPADLLTPGFLLAALLLFYGAFLCFAGHRLFVMHLVFIGALAGGVAGFSLGQAFSSTIVAVILCVLLGLVGGVLLISSLVIGLGAFGGTLLVFLAWPFTASFAFPLRILVAAIAFVAGATLALVLGRFLIVLGTSLEGAALTVLCGCALLAGKEIPAMVDTIASHQFLDALARVERTAILITAAFFVLFVAGMIVQYSYGKASTET